MTKINVNKQFHSNLFPSPPTLSPTGQRFLFLPSRAKKKGSEGKKLLIGACFANSNWNVFENVFTTLGYSPERAHDPDLLYFILIEKDGIKVLKIGRSFYGVKKRFAEEDIIVLKNYGLWKGTHQVIYKTEQSVLKAFDEYKYAGEPFSGSSECFELTLHVDQVLQFIKDKFPEVILIAGSETQNQTQSIPSAQKRKSINLKVKTANPKANSCLQENNLGEALQWKELLLNIPVFTKLIMALDKNTLSGEASTLLRSFYSFSVGIIFLSVLAHVAEENGIAKKDIADRSSYGRVRSKLVGKSSESKLIKAFYSQQENVNFQLKKGASKRTLLKLYEFLIELSHNQEFSDEHRSATQRLLGTARTLPIWHPNKLLPGVNPQTIDANKAFELTTNALTQANNQLTKDYIEDNFGITPEVVIDDCSQLLNFTTFVDDFDCKLLLAQELACC